MTNNTIFDDVFRTMVEKMTYLLVPLINEVFHTSYPKDAYTDLNKLIVRISDYIFRKEENVRKGVDEVMGGKVLQLESERLREEGMAIGEARGKAEGEAIGEARVRMLINRLIADGRMDEIGKIIDSAEACRELYKEYGL